MTELNKRRVKRIETHEGETPLGYALRVMRDPKADVLRRDRMAIAALPYCHPRLEGRRVTKKQIAEQRAKLLDSGWDEDLRVDGIQQ